MAERKRAELLRAIADEIAEYFLDNCPEDENWEDFDPQLDQIKTEIESILS